VKQCIDTAIQAPDTGEKKGGEIMSTLTEKLREKQAGQAKNGRQVWKPEEGEILEGVVTQMGSTITQFGDAEYLDIKDDQGHVWTVFLSKVLKTKIDEELVEEGDRVAIEFLGLKKAAKGTKKYKDYLVVCEKNPAADDDLDDLDDSNLAAREE